MANSRKVEVTLPFSGASWYEPWISAFAKSSDLVEVNVGERRETLLTRNRVNVHGVSLRALTSLTNCHTPSYEWPEGLLDTQALSKWLKECRVEYPWQILQIELVPNGCATQHAFEGLADIGWKIESQPWSESAYISLKQGEDVFFKAIPKKLRTNTNRAENGLGRLGNLEFKEVSSSVDWESWFERCLILESESWKGQAGTAISQQKNEEKFYWRVVRAERDLGRMKLYVLMLDDELIGFNLLLQSEKTYYGMKMSFRSDLAKYSPGNVLQRLVLRDLFAEGNADKLDMLDPVTPWKMRWATGTQELMRIRVYAPEIKPLFVYYFRCFSKALAYKFLKRK